MTMGRFLTSSLACMNFCNSSPSSVNLGYILFMGIKALEAINLDINSEAPISREKNNTLFPSNAAAKAQLTAMIDLPTEVLAATVISCPGNHPFVYLSREG